MYVAARRLLNGPEQTVETAAVISGDRPSPVTGNWVEAVINQTR